MNIKNVTFLHKKRCKNGQGIKEMEMNAPSSSKKSMEKQDFARAS